MRNVSLWQSAMNIEDRQDQWEESEDADPWEWENVTPDAAQPTYCAICQRVSHECDCYDGGEFDDTPY